MMVYCTTTPTASDATLVILTHLMTSLAVVCFFLKAMTDCRRCVALISTHEDHATVVSLVQQAMQ